MLKRRRVMPIVSVIAALVSSGAAAEITYSCYFPVKCTAPDGDCGLASIRKDFSLSDASSDQELGSRRVFNFPDLSAIYVQENGKSALVFFLDDAVSSVETAHGVCNLGDNDG